MVTPSYSIESVNLKSGESQACPAEPKQIGWLERVHRPFWAWATTIQTRFIWKSRTGYAWKRKAYLLMTLCVRCWEKMFNHTGMPAVAHAQSESSKPWLENRAVNRNYSSSKLPLKHTRRRSSSRKPSWGIESTWPRARNPKADSRAKAQRPQKKLGRSAKPRWAAWSGEGCFLPETVLYLQNCRVLNTGVFSAWHPVVIGVSWCRVERKASRLWTLVWGDFSRERPGGQDNNTNRVGGHQATWQACSRPE